MRSLSVKYHVVADALARLQFPAEELRSLYETSGIDVQFEQGERIMSDPAFSALQDYPSFVQRYGKNDRGSGHLIIGLGHPRFLSDIAGELLDLDSRGVAVIYTSSDYIQRSGQGALLQTCAHELGHMLNLAHQDVASFDSVMNQAQDRWHEIPVSWDYAAAEARRVEDRGQPAYFDPPARPLNCYPFAYAARLLLNTYSSDRLLPWGGRFERPYDGANDAWRLDSSLRLEPEQQHFMEGGPFAFSIRLRNLDSRPKSIPAQIGPEFDTLLLTVTRPDGSRYRHRPRTLACSRRCRLLMPGETITRYFCTVRGPGGAVFPKPGRYLVTATLPQAQAVTEPVEIHVEPRGEGPLTDPRFRRFIADGVPLRRPRYMQRLDELLASHSGVDPLARGYLALLRARRERDHARVATLLEIAAADGSPTAVRHAAAVSHIKMLFRAGPLEKDSLQQVTATYLRREEDRYLIERLEQFHARWMGAT
jgi:hypothetical protein